jgi:hypothetical protein
LLHGEGLPCGGRKLQYPRHTMRMFGRVQSSQSLAKAAANTRTHVCSRTTAQPLSSHSHSSSFEQSWSMPNQIGCACFESVAAVKPLCTVAATVRGNRMGVSVARQVECVLGMSRKCISNTCAFPTSQHNRLLRCQSVRKSVAAVERRTPNTCRPRSREHAAITLALQNKTLTHVHNTPHSAGTMRAPGAHTRERCASNTPRNQHGRKAHTLYRAASTWPAHSIRQDVH